MAPVRRRVLAAALEPAEPAARRAPEPAASAVTGAMVRISPAGWATAFTTAALAASAPASVVVPAVSAAVAAAPARATMAVVAAVATAAVAVAVDNRAAT